ncbi:hypothetical protein ELI71_32725, partial [Klebsiella pneumoniae]|nr:hypothetical protein [Klebsiella pneumoniae]
TYEAWFGWTAQSIFGKTIQQVFAEQGYGDDVYQGLRPHIREALAGRRVAVEVERMVKGEMRHLDVHYIPHWDVDGTVAGF